MHDVAVVDDGLIGDDVEVPGDVRPLKHHTHVRCFLLWSVREWDAHVNGLHTC